MKPAAFEYVAPRSVDEALRALEALGEDAKVLAGGQSLVPAMNFRLARPSALVDIGRIPGLDDIRVDDDVHIGALVRHRRLEVGGEVPDPLGELLSRIAGVVGHLPIRTRGTFGGSLAHADPASEWCVLSTLLDAEVIATSLRGDRAIPARDFFVTVFTTALEPDEIVTEVRLPLLTAEHRVGFAEFSRRAGDFAIVMAMTMVELQEGVVRAAAVALGGVADRPVRSPEAERVLVGAVPDPAVLAEAGAAAAAAVNPNEDLHGSPEFRRDLVRAMVSRALEQAVGREVPHR